jgi:hypothetical protein
MIFYQVELCSGGWAPSLVVCSKKQCKKDKRKPCILKVVAGWADSDSKVELAYCQTCNQQ